MCSSHRKGKQSMREIAHCHLLVQVVRDGTNRTSERAVSEGCRWRESNVHCLRKDTHSRDHRALTARIRMAAHFSAMNSKQRSRAGLTRQVVGA
jgi:hypothetical protein